MRRSLVIMLSASVVVHAVAVVAYVLSNSVERRGSSSAAQSPSLLVSTSPSAPIQTDAQINPPPTVKTPALTESPSTQPETVKPLSNLASSSDSTFSPIQNPSPIENSPKFPITPKTVVRQEPTPSVVQDLIAKPSQPAISAASTQPSPGHRSVVFLLDVSGSMYEIDGYSTRSIQARRILAKLIAALPSDEMFTIVYYAETSLIAAPFQFATETVKKSSLHYVAQEVECGGGTNLPIGLQTAFELHPAEIVLLTDGDLNMDFQGIVSAAPSYQGDKTPAIKIIGIDPREGSNDTDLLKSLADHYDGTFSSVPLLDPDNHSSN